MTIFDLARSIIFFTVVTLSVTLAMLPQSFHLSCLMAYTYQDYGPDPWDRPYERYGFDVTRERCLR